MFKLQLVSSKRYIASGMCETLEQAIDSAKPWLEGFVKIPTADFPHSAIVRAWRYPGKKVRLLIFKDSEKA